MKLRNLGSHYPNHTKSFKNTFCKIDMSCTVLGAILRLEIHHQPFDALFRRRD